MKGFVSLPRAIAENNEPIDKVRGKPEKFAEHYNQATLFFNSQTPVEQAHIIGAFRFELSKVTVPAIRQRMVSGLRNVSEALASTLATSLGLELPDPMPRALEEVPRLELKSAPSLSLMACPGEGGIATRKVAILVADGMTGAPIATAIEALTAAKAVTRLLSSRLGFVTDDDGNRFEIDATLENTPAVLFDALVLPDGADAVAALSKDGHTLEFLKDQYRHGKSIWVLGDSAKLLKKAGIVAALPSGDADPGLLLSAPSEAHEGMGQFISAIAKHRHPQRDTDPPLI
jgi:catalase